jgi:hypothetical protein
MRSRTQTGLTDRDVTACSGGASSSGASIGFGRSELAHVAAFGRAARCIGIMCVTSVMHDWRASVRRESRRTVTDRWSTGTRACSSVWTPPRARPSGHARSGRAPVVRVDVWMRVRVDEASRLEFGRRRFGGGTGRETSLENASNASAGDADRRRDGTCRFRPRTVVRPTWSLVARCGPRFNSAADRSECVSHDRLFGGGQRVGRPTRAAHDTNVVSGPMWLARVMRAGATQGVVD